MLFPFSGRLIMTLFGVSLTLLLSVFQGTAAERKSLSSIKSWVVYYGQNIDIPALSAFDLAVLDPNFHGSLEPLDEAGTLTIGYLSLGEIRKSDPDFQKVALAKILLDENPNWPGTMRLDVRNEAWTALVLDELIPSLMKRGFKGLFFDTLDTPPYLEAIEPVKYKGMGAAAVELVKKIRGRYPELILIANRGYMILPQLAPHIDAVVAESLLTSHSPAKGGYSWTDQSVVEQQLKFLNVVRVGANKLPVLSLDYWEPGELTTIKKIYDKERALGHIPYVSTPLLDQVLSEPKH